MDNEEVEERLKLVRTLLISISIIVSFGVLRDSAPAFFLYSFILGSIGYYALLVNRARKGLIVLVLLGVSFTFTAFSYYLLRPMDLSAGASAVLAVLSFPITFYALKPSWPIRPLVAMSVASAYRRMQQASYRVPLVSLNNYDYSNLSPLLTAVNNIHNKIRRVLYDNW